MIPHAGNESNWIIKRNGTHSIEMVITNATSKMNKRTITCTAGNGIRTVVLVYQNFVGGEFITDKIIENVVIEFSRTHECHCMMLRMHDLLKSISYFTVQSLIV